MNIRAWFKKAFFPVNERGTVLVTGLLIVLVGLYFKVLRIRIIKGHFMRFLKGCT